MIIRVTGLLLLICLFEKCTAESEFKIEGKLPRSKIKPKIVKGEPAAPGEIPYQVSFKTLDNKSNYYNFCGGSILKPKIVLSAAHCFVNQKLSFYKYCSGRIDKMHYRSTYVVAGNLNNSVYYSKRGEDGQWKRISYIAIPYSYNFVSDDIAIVHLRSPFTFNSNVSSIPYAQQYKTYFGLQCLASGYGMTGKSSVAKELQKAYLEIKSNEMCHNMLKSLATQTKKSICTSNKITNVNKGDSGGPLVCQNTGDPAEDSKGVLVGITSIGTVQGSAFTRVSSFAKYIARGKANISKSLQKLQYLFLLICILL